MPDPHSILIVRLGAMGDVLHAVPAAISLKRSFPSARVLWAIRARWLPLLDGNPFVDDRVVVDRRVGPGLLRSIRELRCIRPGLAFDFQGLVQSAAAGWLARPAEYWGFAVPFVRERLACLFYSRKALPPGMHRIERNLGLVKAAEAPVITTESWVPQGREEGVLPKEPFVLANPFAGWIGKQWPLESYVQLAGRLKEIGLRLVVNVSHEQVDIAARDLPGVFIHASSLPGLIHATRRAAAVVGLDSGPLHLAAALGKPGVGLYGPTDPATHGPFGGSMEVLRSAGAPTTYVRHNQIQESMKRITPMAVVTALQSSLARHSEKANPPV